MESFVRCEYFWICSGRCFRKGFVIRVTGCYRDKGLLFFLFLRDSVGLVLVVLKFFRVFRFSVIECNILAVWCLSLVSMFLKMNLVGFFVFKLLRYLEVIFYLLLFVFMFVEVGGLVNLGWLGGCFCLSYLI